MSAVTTLKQNTEFHRVYGRGKSVSSPVLVTYALKSRHPVCRVGITASKKLGNAVARNRCRRVIRAAYMSLAPECNGGWDIVFVARFRTRNQKMQSVAAVMERQLIELGVIESDSGEIPS